jgi:hypothetical protein
MRSRRLDDFVGTQAARANADALDTAIDERPHCLKIGLEPACADVVSVTHLTSHNRSLSAEFTTFGHSSTCVNRVIESSRN